MKATERGRAFQFRERSDPLRQKLTTTHSNSTPLGVARNLHAVSVVVAFGGIGKAGVQPIFGGRPQCRSGAFEAQWY